MKRSTDRILATHIGSLPRPASLSDENLADAIADAVRRQAELGIDVVTDGEFGKPSFLNYVNDRLGGFEPHDVSASGPWEGSRETESFPEYYGRGGYAAPMPAATAQHMICTAPIAYRGHDAVQRDIDNLRAALAGLDVAEAFLPAISPSNVAQWNANSYYESDEEYLFALADALNEEYRAIVGAGFLLQVDDPALVTYYVMHPEASVEECRRWARTRVEALNHALRGIEPARVRFHTCYSINIGPRVHDMELADMIDIMLEVNAGAYSFEAANSRHEHEWRLWGEVDLPEEKLLIPGVVTNSSVMIEHPEVVADRIERFVSVVGRERVIAGADCGFASFAGNDEIDPRIAWAKLGSIVEGARIASERLFR